MIRLNMDGITLLWRTKRRIRFWLTCTQLIGCSKTALSVTGAVVRNTPSMIGASGKPTIWHAGQIARTAMTNKSLYTNVAIQKTGYAEVMSGRNIRYSFSGIANNSTTSLTSFYWRDTLPVESLRLAKITTGTYNAVGNYKIVYKTNLSGSEYRVLADSLNTQQNYVLDASPVALRLGSNEYVTEVMFVFGVVPSNFRQVETPMIDCSVVSWVKGGSQFINQADVGGVYDGQWIMATSRWVTKVYAPSKPLPRTGY